MSECCVREGFAATGRLSVGPLVSTPAPRSTPISPPSPPSSTSYECRHAPPPWGGRPSPARPKQSPNRCTIGGRRLPPKQRGGRGEKGTSVGRHPNGVTPSPLAATRRLPSPASACRGGGGGASWGAPRRWRQRVLDGKALDKEVNRPSNLPRRTPPVLPPCCPPTPTTLAAAGCSGGGDRSGSYAVMPPRGEPPAPTLRAGISAVCGQA